MLEWLPDLFVYLGAGLMVYNIYGFGKFAARMKQWPSWGNKVSILYIPIFLLVMFLIGYLLVAMFGIIDWIISGILFGGSVFVFIIYLLLNGITNRMIEGERLEIELKTAEESNRKKNEFLASISHEMRTPMNVILGMDSIALKNPALPPETRVQLEKIGKSGRHLLGLINNILEMQAVETGQLTVKQEAFSLPEALQCVADISGVQCEEKRLSFRMVLSDDLPARVVGDEMMLRQILLNLLDNAAKFTDSPGQVTLTVDQLPAASEERRLRFVVRDTGVGIAPEFLPKVFDLFAQEDAGFTNRFSGSGLGLSSTKNKVELMRGEITVESEKNKGSAFTVILPFQTAPEAEAPAEEQPGQETVSLAGRRILIVDDVEENVEIAADLLELEGAESEQAENGRAALEMFKKSPLYYYDAVLMDLRMPVMDGLESARRIRGLEREDAKTMPIIALTANAFETDIQHSLSSGMNEHLVKPVDADVLYETLKKWIARSQKNGKRGENR